MQQPDRRDRPRKPARRTAWVFLLGGLALAGLLFGGGGLILANGQDVGPGRTAVWPAGELGTVRPHLGFGTREGPANCQESGPDGRWEASSLGWFDDERTETEVRFTCEEEAIFVTGNAVRVLDVFQSPLIAVPMLMVLISPLLFFPRVGMTLLMVFSVKSWFRVFLRGQRP